MDFEEQVRQGELTAEAIARANQRTLDMSSDALDGTLLSMGAAALDDTFRELLRRDPT